MLAIDLVMSTQRRFLHLVTAAGFLLIGANFAEDPLAAYTPNIGPVLWRTVVQVSYLGTIALIVTAAFLSSPKTPRRHIKAALKVGAVALSGLFFGALLWQFLRDPLHDWGPILGSGAEDGLLAATAVIPVLLFLSVTALVRLFYGIGQAMQEVAARRMSARVAKALLLLVVATELYLVGWNNHGFWDSLIADNAVTTVEYAVVAALFVVLTILFIRRQHSPEIEVEHTDQVTIIIEALYVVPTLLILILSGTGKFFEGRYSHIGFLSSLLLSPALENIVVTYVIRYGYGADILVLLLAYCLYRLTRKSIGDSERARLVGYSLIAFWVVVASFLDGSLNGLAGFKSFDYNVHTIADYFLPLVVTSGVGVILIFRWKYLGVRQASFMGALVVFAWLIGSRGSPLTHLGQLIEPNSNLLIVVGVVLTILTGSEFANRDGRWLARESRSVLWILYLALSLMLVLWVSDTTDGVNEIQILTSGATAAAWLFFAFPFAVWLVVTDRFRPNKTVAEELERRRRQIDPANLHEAKARQSAPSIRRRITTLQPWALRHIRVKGRRAIFFCVSLGAVTVLIAGVVARLPSTPNVPSLIELKAPGLASAKAAKMESNERQVSVGIGSVFVVPSGWKISSLGSGSAVLAGGSCRVAVYSLSGLSSPTTASNKAATSLEHGSIISCESSGMGSLVGRRELFPPEAIAVC